MKDLYEIDRHGDVQLIIDTTESPIGILEWPPQLDDNPIDLLVMGKKSGRKQGKQKKKRRKHAKHLMVDFGLVHLFQPLDDQFGRETMPASSDSLTLSVSDSVPEPAQPAAESLVPTNVIGLTEGIPAEGPLGSPQITRIRVSSRHLCLASSHFEKSLNGVWLEGDTLKTTGFVEVSVGNCDLDAMLAILHIIHGRTRQVPRQVDLKTLTNIAILVDYYTCHEAVEIFTDIWLAGIEPPRADEPRDILMCWLCIYWVLRKSDQFHQLTLMIVRQVEGPLHSAGLPIPHSVMKNLDSQRLKALGSVLSSLHRLIYDLSRDQVKCSFECDSARLGALLKNMSRNEFLLPFPDEPYSGISVADIFSRIREFRDLQFRPPWGMYGGYSEKEGHVCPIAEIVLPIISEAESHLIGSNLSGSRDC